MASSAPGANLIGAKVAVAVVQALEEGKTKLYNPATADPRKAVAELIVQIG